MSSRILIRNGQYGGTGIFVDNEIPQLTSTDCTHGQRGYFLNTVSEFP